MNTRIKEHRRCCRLLQPEKSAVAEHILANSDHDMLFEDTKILSSSLHFMTRLHREAIEIFKHGLNINRKEETLRVNKAWYPALRESRLAVIGQQLNSIRRHEALIGSLPYGVNQSENSSDQNVNIRRPHTESS